MKQRTFDNAFTGLEAAIVLIAFIVVAAVFSYVVLGAGFFTTQKAQETVHTGVAQASSSLEIVGNVYGFAPGASPTSLGYTNVTVALTAGGTAMDLSQMVVSYNDGTTRWANLTLEASTCGNTIGAGTPKHNVYWCIAETLNDVGTPNQILDPNEQFILAVSMPTTSTVNTKFTVNLQPAVGAVLPITRTVPGAIHAVQALY